MRPIIIDKIKPGVKIALPLYNSEGKILLKQNTALNEPYIQKLRALGVSTVYIHDKRFENIEAKDVIEPELRIRTIKTMRDYIYHFAGFKDPDAATADLNTFNEIALLLVDRLSAGGGKIAINLMDIKPFESYESAHLTNTAVLSVIAGVYMGMKKKELLELCLGVLMHDIGKALIDKKVLNKPANLTKEEFNILSKHPELGCRLIKNCRNYPAESLKVVLLHHEKLNKKGYPFGVGEDKLNTYTRIASVADIYDALTSDRIYRKKMLPHNALKLIANLAGAELDRGVVNSYREFIIQYPISTLVELNTGEKGIVVRINKENNAPVVRLHYDRFNRELTKPLEVDLGKDESFEIADVLEDI